MPDLLIETPTAGVRLLRLNRPEKRNALATPLLEALAAALTEAERDVAVRAVVITGGDRIFAAGADLDELAQSTSQDEIEGPRFRAWAVVRGFAKPLIAAVEGWCLGAGFELLLCADIAIAGSGARLGLPETNLGIMPGAGGTATLPRIVGRSLAMEMVLGGQPIAAERALTAGLLASIVGDGEATEAALALATKLAARAPDALRTAKASIRNADTLGIADHLLAERRAFVGLLSGAEKIEGIAAFREKREAKWQ